MEIIDKTLEKLNNEELIELQKLIRTGKADKFIENKLEKFKNSNKICPVCNTEIKEKSFTLIFGSLGFKKKAIFDGLDCLEYFITKLKE